VADESLPSPAATAASAIQVGGSTAGIGGLVDSSPCAASVLTVGGFAAATAAGFAFCRL